MIKTCWVVTEGKAGMEMQGQALADALKIPQIITKRVTLRFPWNYISPCVRFAKQFSISNKGDTLNPPWPDLVITAGRRSVLAGLLIKHYSPATKLICVQNPRISSSHFDVVIPSDHDQMPSSPNVIPVFGAIHRVTKEKLLIAEKEFQQTFSNYPQPKIGVIVGGNSRAYKMDLDTIKKIFEDIKLVQQQHSASLLITASRRTPPEVLNFLRKIKLPNTFYWDAEQNGQTANPYLGILASADALLVTCESINMISEACATTAPVYLLRLPGHSKRFDNFHQTLFVKKRIEWFEKKICFNKAEALEPVTKSLIKKIKEIIDLPSS